MAQRIKTVQESDLRMLGALARSIQRVLPVTQEDIDAAAALGKGWVVTRVFEVTDPLDNLRGGTQLVIRQNSVLPGQSVQRVLLVSGPGGQTVVVRGSDYIALPDAIANSLSYVKAFGGTEQRNLPEGYTELEYIESNGTQYIDTGVSGNATIKITAQASEIKGSSQALLSSTSLASGGTWFGEFTTNQKWGIGSGGGLSTIDPTTKMTAEITFDGSGCSGTVNGESITRSATITQGGWTIMATSQLNYPFSGKVWGCQITQSGTLVRNFVPAKNSSNVVGMYDTVSGTFFTNAGTGDFIAGNAATPTPDAPMGIVCNNGVLKARHESGLPLGYTLLDYIESSRTQYIDTDVYISTGYKVRVKAYATSVPTSIAFFGCTTTADASNAHKGIFRIIGASLNRCAWGNGSGSIVGGLTGNDSANTWYDMVCDNGVWTINDILFATCQEVSFTSEYSMWLFARNTGGTVGLPASCRISVCQIWDNNGQMIRNLVPAKNASNVVGMYDLVSGQFFTNAGTGTFTAGGPVSDPVEIYTDGTVETISVHTKNLFGGYTTAQGYWQSNGTWSSDANYVSFQYIAVKPNTTYTISNETAPDYWRLALFNGNVFSNRLLQQGGTSFTFTTGANENIISIAFRTTVDVNKCQLEQGSPATDYVPYYNGGTATCEDLLSVGTYTDEQEVIAGGVTRKVGVKVLDGTENWAVAHAATYTYTINVSGAAGQSSWSVLGGLCSHLAWYVSNTTPSYVNVNPNTLWFNASADLRVKTNSTFATLADWTQYLAAQYAAGTPVIVVYPLATETTETVTGQPMSTTQGDNIAEITQASMDGLELEAEYQAAVSLTIQEVQDANLDNNVTVTIS